LPDGVVTGCNRDGTLKKAEFEVELLLVPIGHWNWKWNSARSRYATYQQELLSGVLVLSAQNRLIAQNKVVWLCDQKAVEAFVKDTPPKSPKLVRWWCFLRQMRLAVFHIPGVKNKLNDYISRNNFDEKRGRCWEDLSQDAFARMDCELDLAIDVADSIISHLRREDYLDDYGAIWGELEDDRRSKIIDGESWYRTETHLFKESKLVIPPGLVNDHLLEFHRRFGHPGVSQTILEFCKRYHVDIDPKNLKAMCANAVSRCGTCLFTQPRSPAERYEVSHLPIPTLAKSTRLFGFRGDGAIWWKRLRAGGRGRADQVYAGLELLKEDFGRRRV
jgi:hypothetical protein